MQDVFGEEENTATSFFLASANHPMEVCINDGSFTSKNGASIASDNVDLTIHVGKFKFDYYNKIISNITSVATWHGKLPEFHIGYDYQYMIIHDGRIGKLPSANQIAFADGSTVTIKTSVLSYIYKVLCSDDLALQKVARGLYGYYKSMQ